MELKTIRILGWFTLILSQVFYYYDSPTSITGIFLNGMALGFFGVAVYRDFKALKKVRARIKREKSNLEEFKNKKDL